jgi:hypothetical protein
MRRQKGNVWKKDWRNDCRTTNTVCEFRGFQTVSSSIVGICSSARASNALTLMVGKDLIEPSTNWNMKITTLILAALLTASTALATLEMLFPGYDRLKDNAPDIIVARCSDTPPAPDHSITGTIRLSNIEIVTAIKGTNCFGPAVLRSDRLLQQGEFYLIYGRFEDGVCAATEDYRVVPLGRESGSAWFSEAGLITNSIGGKPQDEQLQILFRRADDHLRREIEQDEKQRKQLQTAIRR